VAPPRLLALALFVSAFALAAVLSSERDAFA
jgi:hypothetical protein